MKNRSFRLCGLFLAGLFCLNACASTGPRHSFEEANFPLVSYPNEDINGDFPKAVYIKTRTQTFNTYHYYILSGGRIWYKNIEPGRKPKNWMLFEKTGLPPGTKAVVEISADADELTALSAEGAFYYYCFDPNIVRQIKVWLGGQGWPKNEQLFLDKRAAGNRAWAVGKRNMQLLYYEDAFGNKHHNGAMDISTTYMLLENGQEIVYADTGLPSDFSRNYIGPERGTFKALSLSASASTMFVINEAGEMYTRMADFDIIGCDPMLFKYTYIPYKSNLAGSDYFSNLTEWALPPEDWRRQPSIPLDGDAAVTARITILQNGQGNAARELRVAGRNGNGETGYWTKAIFDDVWEFITAPLHLNEEDFLRMSKGDAVQGEHGRERGRSLDKRYSGYWWNKGEREGGENGMLEYEIPNFNILEGSCDLRVTYRGETCVLKLHPVEMWTYLKRDYLPGRVGPPKLFLVTLEIPENAFAGLSEDFIRHINDKFAKNDKAPFKYVLAASARFLILRNTDRVNGEEQEPALFLTDGTLSDYFPEFRRTWYIADYDEFRRYSSPDLVFTTGTHNELSRKIERNKTFLAKLKTRIAGMRSDKAAAVTLNMIYLPFHYIARFTPLRFVDTPKIRTMTSYGEEIVLTNSQYTGLVSDTRIWVDQRIINLLEARIKCYEDLARQTAHSRHEVSIPGWYSETAALWWDIAGLPRTITGGFAAPNGDIPAVLQFHTGEENGEFLGWYLAISGGGSFVLFIDPGNSAETIYSRQGKTPERNELKINGTLYINPGRTSPQERNIIENSLAPFSRAGQGGIDISIVYDGETFEIREFPSRHGGALIFRGHGTP